MKVFGLLVTVLVFGASGFLIKVPIIPSPTQPRAASVPGWVHLQKLILPLFENVCEDSSNEIIVRLAQEYSLDSSDAVYLKPEVVTNLKTVLEKGLLPKGEIFVDYYPNHLNELRAIYEVLFYAKDFDTFYKAAAWARQNVNCGLFVRAIYLAVLNRRDTEKLSVPAPYELLPHYFIQKDTIFKASALLSGSELSLDENIQEEGNSYVLKTNYTADYLDNDYESKLAYFHEDIGLNSYYFLQKLRRSPWFNTTPNLNVRYGEYLYHMMKQLAARYDLERYANGFPELPIMELNTFVANEYDPLLIYSNGKDFGYRTTAVELMNSDGVGMIENVENNIANVVLHLRETGYNKTEIMNHLMEILVTEERSFENILRIAFGKDSLIANSQPGVLDHHLTSLRDPVFWKINKKIVDVIENALNGVFVYNRNELYFPGVEILNVEVKKMATNFDFFQFDVTDALKSEVDTTFQVKISEPRLNHKPFVVKLNISSLINQRGLVKIYLGPKVAPGEFPLKKNMFMVLDNFEYNFKIGSNIVTRSSEQMSHLADDFTSLTTLHKYVADAEFGLNSLPLKDIQTCVGFPQRLLLPKGSAEGLPLQIFVFVAPFVKSTLRPMNTVSQVEYNSAILSPGYPLDLDVDDLKQLLVLPNAMIKDVIITHKGDKIFGGSGTQKNWANGNYDQSSQPEYAAQRKEPFDYASKKGQYGKKEGAYEKKEDYAAKSQYYKEKSKNRTTEVPKPKSDTTTVNPNEDVIVKDLENDINYNYNEGKQIEDDDSSLTNVFAKKPSVYDYIVNTEDYYDEDDDTRVYE